MQRNRGLSFSIRLYGEPAKTLRRFCLRRRSQRSPLWLKEFKIQVQSSAALTFVTTRPFESKLSWRSLLQKFKVKNVNLGQKYTLIYIYRAEKGEKVRVNVKNSQRRANFSLFIFHFSFNSVPLHPQKRARRENQGNHCSP